MLQIGQAIAVVAVSLALASAPEPVYAGAGKKGHGHDDAREMMQNMREKHSAHEHGHDFEAMENMSREEMTRMVALMQDVGLVVPRMDAVRGRKLFVETGCVVCHSVNSVGGDIGPSLNADDMPSPMNAFEFAARMWRGAAAMTAMQQDMFGDVIALTGQDLIDLVAFAHDGNEQKKLAANQIPEKFHKMLEQ